jgi:hypothetical protein
MGLGERVFLGGVSLQREEKSGEKIDITRFALISKRRQKKSLPLPTPSSRDEACLIMAFRSALKRVAAAAAREAAPCLLTPAARYGQLAGGSGFSLARRVAPCRANRNAGGGVMMHGIRSFADCELL